MRRTALFLLIIFASLHAFSQNNSFHYIKFLHVGERIMRVPALNISTGNGEVPIDSAEVLNDTIPSVSVVTDQKSYGYLRSFLKYSSYKLVKNPGVLEFGTLKVISDNNRYFISGSSAVGYFKKMIKYLKSKKADPGLIQAIINNYPWVFNP
jgi:hypothetical protein